MLHSFQIYDFVEKINLFYFYRYFIKPAVIIFNDQRVHISIVFSHMQTHHIYTDIDTYVYAEKRIISYINSATRFHITLEIAYSIL